MDAERISHFALRRWVVVAGNKDKGSPRCLDDRSDGC